MIGRHAVAAQQGEILDIGVGFGLFAIDGVGEVHVAVAIAGDAEAQGEGLAGGGAAVAFFARKFAHARVEEPGALRAGLLAIAAVGEGEIAIGQALLRRWRRRLSRCSARRSDCLYSSSQPRSSQRRPSKMELSDASVLRSTSVSSMRRIIVPPLWRAYSQLKMNVRALPMCRNPVGDGAKRTLGMEMPV